MLLSRKSAKAAGLTEYFTGKPCSRGMISARAVADRKCQCEAHCLARAEGAARRYMANRAERLAKQKAYAQAHPEALKAASRRSYVAGKAKAIARAAGWAASNPDRRREIASKWASDNPASCNANVRRRQMMQANATPPWFDEFDALVMAEAYDLAKRREATTGIKWHVDHKLPIRGKKVCGLHVAENIQVIPAIINRRKGNKFSMEHI